MDPNRGVPRRGLVWRFIQACIVAAAFLFVTDTVAASNAASGLSDASRESMRVPQWLYLSTGGAVIGASALLASFVTDRGFIREIHDWQRNRSLPDSVRRSAVAAVRALGVVGLVVVVYTGVTGPQIPTVSFAILVTFVGVRAGLTMVSYLVGNVWRVLNPWRTLTEYLPTGYVSYPSRAGRWPAVFGLFVLVWIELVTAITTRPAVLASVVVGYSIITITGAVLFTPDTWFHNADPVSVLFRFYGSVSPVTRDSTGVSVALPGSGLVESEPVDGFADVAFVIALIWELTFSGFVTTTAGAQFVESVVGFGVPPLLVYGSLLLGGYGVFAGAYWLGAKLTRRTIATYVTPQSLALRFAPPLLAIAAGYHLAHYAGFFVSMSPSLTAALTTPFSPPANPLVLTLPDWFGGLDIAFILLGHLLAIFVAHVTAYDLFPSRLQAIRSQYPFVAVMIGYTVLSLWIVSLPSAMPPYLG
ncbi:hypothetical protein [Halostella sp. PRR32]|uniref:hypothetical protein n=1 Tax=Halostella sp. PRR32 TaxID=3098147 RepID=UPI002B1D34B8|nr:hypothetical protein [Halostella sp. PRR32]